MSKNKLEREVTDNFYKNENSFYEVKSIWKSLKNKTAEQHVVYSILRGKDWRKNFTAITNSKKLENGRKPYDTARLALENVNFNWSFYLSPFKEHLSDRVEDQLSSCLNIGSLYYEESDVYEGVTSGN